MGDLGHVKFCSIQQKELSNGIQADALFMWQILTAINMLLSKKYFQGLVTLI